MENFVDSLQKQHNKNNKYHKLSDIWLYLNLSIHHTIHVIIIIITIGQYVLTVVSQWGKVPMR